MENKYIERSLFMLSVSLFFKYVSIIAIIFFSINRDVISFDDLAAVDSYWLIITFMGIIFTIFHNNSKRYVFFNDKGITTNPGWFVRKERTYEWSQIKKVSVIYNGYGEEFVIFLYSTVFFHVKIINTMFFINDNEEYIKEIFQEINKVAGRNIAS